jgi:hypothetical protein
VPKTKTSQTADFRARRDIVYAKVVSEMRKRSSKQVFATLVDAGIYTRNGRLTKHYRPA